MSTEAKDSNKTCYTDRYVGSNRHMFARRFDDAIEREKKVGIRSSTFSEDQMQEKSTVNRADWYIQSTSTRTSKKNRDSSMQYNRFMEMNGNPRYKIPTKETIGDQTQTEAKDSTKIKTPKIMDQSGFQPIPKNKGQHTYKNE